MRFYVYEMRRKLSCWFAGEQRLYDRFKEMNK